MLQGGNFVVTRAALEAIGGFDTSVAFFGEDTTTAAQLAAVGKVRFVPALWSYSSGRRYAKEGVVWTTWRYVVNYIWVTFKHRPYNQDYTDVRQ
jgi:GT2 family glycosyltransferase